MFASDFALGWQNVHIRWPLGPYWAACCCVFVLLEIYLRGANSTISIVLILISETIFTRCCSYYDRICRSVHAQRSGVSVSRFEQTCKTAAPITDVVSCRFGDSMSGSSSCSGRANRTESPLLLASLSMDVELGKGTRARTSTAKRRCMAMLRSRPPHRFAAFVLTWVLGLLWICAVLAPHGIGRQYLPGSTPWNSWSRFLRLESTDEVALTGRDVPGFSTVAEWCVDWIMIMIFFDDFFLQSLLFRSDDYSCYYYYYYYYRYCQDCFY